MTSAPRSPRRGPVVAGVLTAAALLVAGCSTTVEGSANVDTAPVPVEGPGSDPVVWADQVCEAVLSFAEPATSAPDFTASNDLPAVQRTMSGFLGNVVTGAQQGGARLAELGKAPEPAGDEAVGKAREAMDALEEDFDNIKASMDDADANDPGAFSATLSDVETRVAAVDTPNPLGDLAAAPRLQRAAERAAQCQRLSTMTADAPG